MPPPCPEELVQGWAPLGTGRAWKKSITTIQEREGNETNQSHHLGTGREWKKAFPKFGNGKGMKKSIPIIRERELEAFILGNGRERELPLTRGSNFIEVLCEIIHPKYKCWKLKLNVCQLFGETVRMFAFTPIWTLSGKLIQRIPKMRWSKKF